MGTVGTVGTKPVNIGFRAVPIPFPPMGTVGTDDCVLATLFRIFGFLFVHRSLALHEVSTLSWGVQFKHTQSTRHPH